MNFRKTQKWRGVCASLLMIGGSVLPAGSVEQDYVLTQRSLKMGDQYTYLTSHGVRLTNPRSGFSIITKAPNWEIELFNEKTHLTYDLTVDHYKHAIAVNGTSEFVSGQWQRQKDPVMVCGLKATQYKIRGTMTQTFANGTKDTNTGVVGGTYVVFEGMRIEPKLAELMCVAYNVPNLSAMPLLLYWETDKGKRLNRVETYRVDRSAIPAAYLDKPNGYKRATSAEMVFLSPDQLEMMTMMASQGATSNPSQATVVQAQKALNKDSSKDLDAAMQQKLGPSFNQRDIRDLMEKFSKKSN